MTDLYNAGNEIEELDFSDTVNIADVDAPHHSSATDSVVPAKPTVFGFDYTGVSTQVAEEAEATAERIRNRHRASIIDTGNDLCVVKDKLAHGQFGNWLRYHFGMSERTAQNYMNAAAAFGSAPKVIDLLPPTTIYKLAAKGAPEEIRKSVIDEVAKGLAPNYKEIDARIVAAQKEERQKRETEQSEKQEQRAWQKHEQALRAAGRTDNEIEKERKRWNAKKAREERDASQKALEAKQRQEAELDAQFKMEQTARTAARILKARLGEDYEKFRDAFLRIDHRQLKTALLSA
ncbi:DUF3102 domain-containing protein [Shinella sp. DD12]|uniref:DUF3102 domain-containing protein n=1 Tax=Shinella sp. DD12 TaxID=1410620 RepID=UPI0003C532E9|nr:DUF3102 domain-containing protein [Shinella sp. DD12]EYR81958.1 hypothetical protein SHLA_84c000060 [Shinella sp. DD12]